MEGTLEGIYDSHTHLLEMKNKGLDLNILLPKWKEQGLGWLMDAAVDDLQFEERLSYSKYYPKLIFGAGIHPGACKDIEKQLNNIINQLKNPKVKALGEIGLDYYWKGIEKSIQWDFFIEQMSIAERYNKPVIIHNREADEDVYEILKKYSCNGVMHCYSSDLNWAKKFLDLGFYISFAGNLTYKKSYNIQETAKYVPQNRLLVETDAPYLSPQAVRGKLNQPPNLIYTLNYISELRNESLEDIKQANRDNFKLLFDITST
jgi:TatD DNase family protein